MFPVPTTAAVSNAIVNLQVLFHEHVARSLEKLEGMVWDRTLIIFVVIQTFLCAWTRWRRCSVWKCIKLLLTSNSEVLTTINSTVNGYVIMQVCNYIAYCFYYNQLMHKYISIFSLYMMFTNIVIYFCALVGCNKNNIKIHITCIKMRSMSLISVLSMGAVLHSSPRQ